MPALIAAFKRNITNIKQSEKESFADYLTLKMNLNYSFLPISGTG